MSLQLTLMLDNVSQHMSQLPAQIAQHEIEVDFDDYITLSIISVHDISICFLL